MSAEKPKRRKPAAKTAKRQRATPADEKAAKIEAVLKHLTQHGNTSRACREAGVERTSFLRWLDEDAKLPDRYARAKFAGIDAEAERMIEIADDQSIPPDSRRVMNDARKWLFARLRPDRYGDRIEQHHTADDGLKAALAARLAQAKTAEARDLGDVDHT